MSSVVDVSYGHDWWIQPGLLMGHSSLLGSDCSLLEVTSLLFRYVFHIILQFQVLRARSCQPLTPVIIFSLFVRASVGSKSGHNHSPALIDVLQSYFTEQKSGRGTVRVDFRASGLRGWSGTRWFNCLQTCNIQAIIKGCYSLLPEHTSC